MAAALRHPPFSKRPGGAAMRDYVNRDGAHALAVIIRHAWRHAGFLVEPEVFVLPKMGPRDERDIYGVRIPGIVNGLPTADVPRVVA
jgi:hypothetical protein